MPPNTACPGDEEILAAVQALQQGGDPDTFGIIFQRFYQPLFQLFANQPALREEADDLAQTTLSRAFENIHQYRPREGSFAAWLRTLAENVWKNAVREALAAKRRRDLAIPLEPAETNAEEDTPSILGSLRDQEPGPEERALAAERVRVLKEALAALPRGMRQCAELRLFAELKYQEIAEVTGIGLGSVRSQLFEARKRLQPVLDAYFQGASF